MRYFYDCEFLEDGRTIELISIGIVAEDGRELYLINSMFGLHRLLDEPWLRENVVPQLPIHNVAVDPAHTWFAWNRNHVDVTALRTRSEMRDEILHFLKKGGGFPELWATYGAYDHICLMQLWGRMMDKHPILPMYTNDLQQLLRSRVINPGSMPQQKGGLHRAIDDARHLKDCYDKAVELGYAHARLGANVVGRP